MASDSMADDERIRELASVLRPKYAERLRHIQELAAERRLHEHARRLDTHDTRSSKVEDNIAAQYARLSTIETGVTELDTKISKIEGDGGTHGTRLSKVEDDVATHLLKIAKGQEDMAGISHHVARHDLKLNEMSSGLDELSHMSLDLAVTASRVDQLSASQVEIKSKQEEERAELQEKFVDLQVTLATLQDTVIRDLDAKVDSLFQKLESSIVARSQIG